MISMTVIQCLHRQIKSALDFIEIYFALVQLQHYSICYIYYGDFSLKVT